MTTSAPVVWCSNPNSEDDKPTAFALQGIKLEGNNVSEQHVLAVRELINAAAKGKLLLPGDGRIVLLNCGVGVGSLIVQDNNQNKENCVQKPLDEVANEIFNKYDELYQFLCCARCMERGKRFCIQNVKMFEKCVTNFSRSQAHASSSGARQLTTTNDITHKRRKTVKFKRNHLINRKVLANHHVNGKSKPDIYATVNKSAKIKNRETFKNLKIEGATECMQTVINNIDNSDIGRKTSFDSTCTISSMDSGFMEMQNKLECIEKSLAMYKSNKNLHEDSKSTVTITEEDVDGETQQKPVPNSSESHSNRSSWNFLSIPTQSKNRRKSYEEFKLMFKDSRAAAATENYEKVATHKKDSSSNSQFKNRRHSIEERNDSVVAHEAVKSEIKSASNDHLDSKIFESTDVEQGNSTLGFLFNRNRKHSKHSLTDKKAAILSDIASVSSAASNSKSCDQNRKLKDFEKLISCGTIYDIIQKKNEFYTKTFKKYDKYMTYGTLYEILHRKFEEIEDIDRKSTLSQKKYSNIEFDLNRVENHYKTVTAATDTVDNGSKTLHSTCISSSASPMKQGSNNNSSNANNQILSTTSSASQHLSTIYDILQSATTTSPQLPPKKERTRFLVQRITEEDLMAAVENSSNEAENKSKENDSIESQTAHRLCDAKVNKSSSSTDHQQQHHQQFKRSRRISNILSSPLKADINTMKLTDRNIQLESKIDELYTRLNRISKSDAAPLVDQQMLLKTPESTKIFKSSSLGILSASESEINRNQVHRPLRKISVPSQKPPMSLPVPKKATRRLSEFTRGEFLNEKA